MLNGVAPTEDDARNSELHIADGLSEQVEEVGEIGNAADIDGFAVDHNLAGLFVVQEQVVHATFDAVCHDALFDLGYSVLLLEIDALVADEKSSMLGKEQMLDAPERIANILVGRRVALDKIFQFLDLLGAGKVLVAIGVRQGILCDP